MTTYYLWLSLPLLSLILYPTKEQINKELRTKETISLQQIKEVKNDTTQLICIQPAPTCPSTHHNEAADKNSIRM